VMNIRLILVHHVLLKRTFMPCAKWKNNDHGNRNYSKQNKKKRCITSPCLHKNYFCQKQWRPPRVWRVSRCVCTFIHSFIHPYMMGIHNLLNVFVIMFVYYSSRLGHCQ
jgi:hypothetical protein